MTRLTVYRPLPDFTESDIFGGTLGFPEPEPDAPIGSCNGSPLCRCGSPPAFAVGRRVPSRPFSRSDAARVLGGLAERYTEQVAAVPYPVLLPMGRPMAGGPEGRRGA